MPKIKMPRFHNLTKIGCDKLFNNLLNSDIIDIVIKILER